MPIILCLEFIVEGLYRPGPSKEVIYLYIELPAYSRHSRYSHGTPEVQQRYLKFHILEYLLSNAFMVYSMAICLMRC